MNDTPRLPLGLMSQVAFAQLDALRVGLDRAWDTHDTRTDRCPSQVVETDSPARLLRYRGVSASGPVVVLVPAPIKTADIWDMEPASSVVRRHVSDGCRVYMLLWPRRVGTTKALGLSDYAHTMLRAAMDAVRSETGVERVFVTGHSLGGTMATLFAARNPEYVAGLTLLGAPLHFRPDIGALGRLVTLHADTAPVTDGATHVPGSLLNTLTAAASPNTFVLARAWDWLESLTDPGALRGHLLVERWTLRETPLPARLFRELVDELYRADAFCRGQLQLAGRAVSPADVVAPAACVVDPRCDIVPPESVLPALERFGTGDREVLWYSGDIGVSLQHVGLLVGRTAHRQHWPQLLAWIRARHRDRTGPTRT